MPATPPVLIVGAGPTGLVLATRLAAHGVPLRIIDRNSGPGQASRAMVLQARTLEFYRQLGFADDVVSLGIKIQTAHLREAGREVARFKFANLGEGLSPYPFVLSYAQDDHERFLVEKLRAAGINVEWGVELTSFTPNDAGVHAVITKGGRQENCEASYLCGCDGAHSRVREGLQLDFPGGTYEQLFYVADVEIEGGFRNDLSFNFGAHNLVLMLPVRSRGMQRLIGTVSLEHSVRTDLTFEDVRPTAEPLLGVRVTKLNWFSTYRVHHRVAGHFRAGRCFIAGDAGHIHSPAGGQGMNTGIGDAINLGWKLANVIQGAADPAILETYETERIAFARTLVSSTDKAFTGIVSPGIGGRLLRTWLLPHVVPTLIRFRWVRHLMFNTVSQIRINYRQSRLSAGEAGRIAAGDRLPWVAFEAGDNFAPLRSLRWQLHIYGAAASRISDAAKALALPVHVFPWNDAARNAGLKRDAAYLVRPDGHVGLASPEQDVASLKDYVRTRGLRFV